VAEKRRGEGSRPGGGEELSNGGVGGEEAVDEEVVNDGRRTCGSKRWSGDEGIRVWSIDWGSRRMSRSAADGHLSYPRRIFVWCAKDKGSDGPAQPEWAREGLSLAHMGCYVPATFFFHRRTFNLFARDIF
jgi:hypothetical protein